jgi:putative membrane protein
MMHAELLVQQSWVHMDGWGGWMWLWGTLGMLTFVASLGVVVWAVIRSTQARPPVASDRAEEIVAERYARGELSTDEYHERLHALRARAPGR